LHIKKWLIVDNMFLKKLYLIYKDSLIIIFNNFFKFLFLGGLSIIPFILLVVVTILLLMYFLLGGEINRYFLLIVIIFDYLFLIFSNVFFIKVTLMIIDKKKLRLGNIFKKIIKITCLYFIANLLLTAILFIGSLIFIIPGVIFYIGLYFIPIIIVDNEINFFRAMVYSYKFIKVNYLELLLYILIKYTIVFLYIYRIYFDLNISATEVAITSIVFILLMMFMYIAKINLYRSFKIKN